MASCDVPVGTAAHLMQTDRRRLTVLLVEQNGPMQLRDLAEKITEITGKSRKSTYICLYQRHLPTLDEHDVIEVGDRGHQVDPGENFEYFADFAADLEERFETDYGGSVALEFGEEGDAEDEDEDESRFGHDAVETYSGVTVVSGPAPVGDDLTGGEE